MTSDGADGGADGNAERNGTLGEEENACGSAFFQLLRVPLSQRKNSGITFNGEPFAVQACCLRGTLAEDVPCLPRMLRR